jgi:CBS domain-containing protein
MNNKTVREVMTRDPVSLPADASVTQAAKAMSDYRIGTVVVMEGNTPCGIVTDRDITVRTVAIEGDPKTTKLGDICSKTVAAVRPDQSVEDVMQVMKSHDVKRVLVIADSKLEGIVSLGDLAARSEGEEVEEDISRSEPNN